ncbi:uncharacterized protein TRIADDRAFT_21611 [Trichoplax adhaerens]|uniref:PX domain-containing protein n=1 Tax=Trichoplax adhaerens TaxID=10228 RepID=B3RPT3_TRIAD|nr:hypothetical protein TRIADDRAFT_21611 [Trichoplax adhaerens]EDV28240.1 hypothetical protein TRIADDRAFT_21611 [Trichoplax adhaerens]|eukprot:XP_002110074.1 hypothetical protein TRIADDRAFT_21611 [Trichoplax adhaerens]
MCDTPLVDTVPSFYREVYQQTCQRGSGKVDKDVFVKVLMKSSLPKQTLSAIYECLGVRKDDDISREKLYKALALAALAQQGKTYNLEALDAIDSADYPTPSLGDLSDLKLLNLRLQREKTPTLLNYTYRELEDLNSVNVEIVPEKKGLFLKHVEYTVYNERTKSTVCRRYSDFCALHEVLLQRFPYRAIPRLPPKKLAGRFLEARCRALRRYLSLICRHPVVHDSEIVVYFLTAGVSDFQNKMKDKFRNLPDEFVTSPLAGKAKDLVPIDTQVSFNESKELLRNVLGSVSKLREIIENIITRSGVDARDWQQFGSELSNLANESHASSAWACGNSHTWNQLKGVFKSLTGYFNEVADIGINQIQGAEDGSFEIFNQFMDILTSYKDLCDRHEKGVIKDHQSALQKMSSMKKRQISAQAKGHEAGNTVDQLESRIIEQESEISNMEFRNYYSLHCVHMETQLVHANMELFALSFQELISQQIKNHKEVLTMLI